MSEKEKIIRLLERVPEYKMKYLLAYTEGLVADEEEDNAFCAALLEQHLNDPDPEKDELVSLEEAAKICGVDLNDL